MKPCPAWCGEHHTHVETMTGTADHTHAYLHEPDGAYVALHRLDPAGEVRVCGLILVQNPS